MTVYLVRHTCKEMAGVMHEEMSDKSNEFRTMFPNQRDFIRNNWEQFIPVAKMALSTMLGDPATPEHRKKEIYNALIEDRWRGKPPATFQGKRLIHG